MSRVQDGVGEELLGATEADLNQTKARVGVLAGELLRTVAVLDRQIDSHKPQSVGARQHQIRRRSAGVVIDRSAQPGEMISPMSVGGFTRTGSATTSNGISIEIEVDVQTSVTGVAAGGPSRGADAIPGLDIPRRWIASVRPQHARRHREVRIRFVRKPGILRTWR